ncbi:MAG: hypothetical protein ACOYIR_05615 [Christensenellales bacterium]|jgi:hypothetical protein
MDINEWQRFCRTGSVRAYLRYKGIKVGESPKQEAKRGRDQEN